MKSVEVSIRQVGLGTFYTVPGGAPFDVDKFSKSGVQLLFGKRKTRTRLGWDCLEGIPDFLRKKDWVEIGARYDVTVKPRSLEAYLRSCLRRSTGGYVAALLAAADIVDVDPHAPARVRLKKRWRENRECSA